MGATVPWQVRVLRLVEDVVEVEALTPSDAEDKALRERGVSRVLGVMEAEPCPCGRHSLSQCSEAIRRLPGCTVPNEH